MVRAFTQLIATNSLPMTPGQQRAVTGEELAGDGLLASFVGTPDDVLYSETNFSRGKLYTVIQRTKPRIDVCGQP